MFPKQMTRQAVAHGFMQALQRMSSGSIQNGHAGVMDTLVQMVEMQWR